VQKFDHNFLSFMPVGQISGFLGNRGITGCYLAMTTPIFLKYFKRGIPFLLLALLCSSILAFAIAFFILTYYFIKIKKLSKLHTWGYFTIILLVIVLFSQEKIINSLHIRASQTIGVLDGIKHNPILGWGAGSFDPIMIKMAKKSEEGKYLGLKISKPDEILGHPHNELLMGWWNFGILFPMLVILYGIYFIRKFTTEKIIPFLIVLTGGLCSLFYFLSPPAWLLGLFALGIYENKKEEICQ
jgi:hypothetical protein